MDTTTEILDAPTYMAIDQESTADENDGPCTSTSTGGTCAWSLSGTDASDFYIGNQENATPGVLSFKKKPNFEKPVDADMDNMYMVRVVAHRLRYTENGPPHGTWSSPSPTRMTPA